MRFHGLLVVGGGFAEIKGNGPRRAGGQTVAEAVAVVVAHEAGLAVLHDDGAFVAGRGTETASGAGFFVDMNDSSEHVFS